MKHAPEDTVTDTRTTGTTADPTLATAATAATVTTGTPPSGNVLSPYATATTWLQHLREGRLSAREALELHIARLDRLNPRLNAVVATDLDGARRRADEADQARRRGEDWGPLHGLPMTIKDTWEVAGMACAAGSATYRHHRPAHHAPSVQRLVDAGAIVYGKTNVSELALDIQSYNAVYGTSRNPWDVARTPGGSSGGAAAALAAGLTPLELGSDIGGSIRIPAHFCGVYGHKPTYGIVPLRGHIPGEPGHVSEPPLGVAGPMARSAEDLQLLLDLIAVPGEDRRPGWSLTLPAPRHAALSAFRVLMWWTTRPAPSIRAWRRSTARWAGNWRRRGRRCSGARPSACRWTTSTPATPPRWAA